MNLTITLFLIVILLGSIGGGIAVRIMFPELEINSKRFRKGIFVSAIGGCLALGLFPALGCVSLSLIAGRFPRTSEVIGLILPGIMAFLGIAVLTPISYRLAGYFISPKA